MFTSLKLLKENDLRTYSYNDIKKVVQALEKINIYDDGTELADFITTTEVLETYSSFVHIIIMRVSNDEVDDLTSPQAKGLLLKRLNTLNERFTGWWRVNSFLRIRFDQMSNSLNESQNEITTQLTTTLIKIQKETEDYTRKIDDSEHNILTHVLTLLGVFSAVIVTIMSVVISSGSWLNSADSSDAMLAFIVPAGIIIIAIITLLSFVYAFQYNSLNKTTMNTEQKASDSQKKKTDKNPIKGLYVTSGIVAVGLGILIISLWWLQHQECKAIHTRYIIPIAECPVEMAKEEELVYRIVYNDKEHDFPCEKAITHGDNLHFCIIHEVLE